MVEEKPIGPGDQIANYVIERELGRGGMGVVYKAHEQSLQRVVALKFLAPHLSSDPAYVARFLREARTAAALSHPGIAHVYAIGEAQGRYFIAMEYIKGRSLAAVLHDSGALSVQTALEIVRQVASALSVAHAVGLVHRDIKPGNIMIDQAHRVHIMDFGLAKLRSASTRLTHSGAVLGTPLYMAPEQAQGKPVNAQADIYSLGVTLYELLAGKPPYDADTPMGLMYQIVHEPFPDLAQVVPGIPEPVVSLVAAMTQKNVKQRLGSATAVEQTIRTMIGMPSQAAAPPLASTVSDEGIPENRSPSQQTVRTPRAGRKQLGIVPVTLLVILGLTGILFGVRGQLAGVTFPDPEVAARMRQILNQSSGPITKKALLKVNKFDITGGNAKSIDGLQYCQNLTNLWLWGGKLSDLRPISGLTKLQEIVVPYNPVADLTPLHDLTNMVKLDCGGAGIKSLAGIERMTKLKWLSIMGGVTDLTPLRAMKDLEVLFFGYNAVSDLSPLADHPNLHSIVIHTNNIGDLSPVKNVPALASFNFSENHVTDLSPLAAIPSLGDICIASNGISDLSPLAPLQLEALHADKNEIVRIDAIKNMTTLKTINFATNHIVDIEPLAALTELVRLSLSSNSIKDIRPLANLVHIEELGLENNKIHDITPLQNLTFLKGLGLSNNAIEDITPLVLNSGLSTGDTVDLEHNPLCKKALCEDIPALKRRGVEVKSDQVWP